MYYVLLEIANKMGLKKPFSVLLFECLYSSNGLFLIPFYLHAVHVHLANGVNLKKA
jgi:hypothetical protein